MSTGPASDATIVHVTKPIPHGGDANGVRARLDLRDAPLVDFSASLSPLGPPPAAIAAAREAINSTGDYPQPGCPRLAERLAELHGVPVANVFVGAGTTELIGLIGQCLREVLALHARELGDPKMALSHIVEPTYGEYRRTSILNELRLESWSKHILGWEQDFLPRSAAGIFWTGHPNNPTGRAWNRDRLLKLVDDTQGLLVVVDEAFLPFLSDEQQRSVASAAANRPNLLVLRSLTKMYAMPGLRIGYAISSVDMVTRLREFQNPWTVTAPAEAAAFAALCDVAHREKSIAMVADESQRVLEHLWDMRGVRPTWPARERPADAPPLPNFVLVSLTETPWNSIRLHDALARRGFLVRECSDFAGLEVGSLLTGPDQLVAAQGHIRFGVRTRPENDRLLSALREILSSQP
jgi:threonine-phosphate decarboxylase